MDAFAKLAFTPGVREEQRRAGSRPSYARMETTRLGHDALGDAEADFVAERDSFYLASVSETGWPYVQHRGGKPGFLKVLDPKHIAFADFRGNLQYISVGAWRHDDRVALILMDYPNRTRLKILGRARVVEKAADPDLLARLEDPAYRAVVERAVVIEVEAFDWNCPQHITPRWTEAEWQPKLDALTRRIQELERENAALRLRIEIRDDPGQIGNQGL